MQEQIDYMIAVCVQPSCLVVECKRCKGERAVGERALYKKEKAWDVRYFPDLPVIDYVENIVEMERGRQGVHVYRDCSDRDQQEAVTVQSTGLIIFSVTHSTVILT